MHSGLVSIRWLAIAFLFIGSIATRADEWPMPKAETYFSQDRHVRFTVTPRAIAGPLAYFQGKIDGEKRAGQRAGNAQSFVRGVLERQQDDGHWSVVWDRALVNDVSPVSALVTNSARYVVTFDNWHSMGSGDNVVVIYGPEGSLVRAMALSDFLPDYYIEALPRTVSSLWWSGKHQFSAPEDHVILKVVIPSDAGPFDEHTTIDVPVQLATGIIETLDSSGWQSALAQAAKKAKELKDEEVARRKWFVEPLLGPTSASEPDWHQYLREAFYRLAPDWKDGSPWTTVLRARTAEDVSLAKKWAREDLRGENAGEGSNLMFATAASSEYLIQILTNAVRTAKPNSLKGKRIYVVAPTVFRDRVAGVLEPTGATVIVLDPAVPIPQRKERLESAEPD